MTSKFQAGRVLQLTTLIVSAASFSFGALVPPICVNGSGVFASTCTGAPVSTLASGFTVNFDGFGGNPPVVIPGLSSTATFSNFAGLGTNQIAFDVSLANTSSLDSLLSAIGFDTTPNVTGGSIANQVRNLGWGVETSQTNFPVGVGTVDFCFSNPGPCASGGNDSNAIRDGETNTFRATLNFASATNSFTFDNLVVRYNAFTTTVGGQTISSAVGRPVVPEPGVISLLGVLSSGVLVFFKKRRERNEQVQS